ncbi:Calcium-responsive transcription factor, partial [Lemmus lemmus]
NCLVKLTVHSLAQKIGDSYRGYCVSETELESILTFHKQQTQSVWGTRQSPSPAKPATRLMWKSQYVPYDGIPFVSAGTSHQLLTGSPVAVFYCENLQWTTDSGNILREAVTVTFVEGNSLGEPVTSRVSASRFTCSPHFISAPNLLTLTESDLPTDTCLMLSSSTALAKGHLPESVQNLGMDRLVEAEDVEDTGLLEGSVNRILLGDVQTVPVRVIGSHPALSK